MSLLHTFVTIILVGMACIGCYMMAYFICISICDGLNKLKGGDDNDGNGSGKTDI